MASTVGCPGAYLRFLCSTLADSDARACPDRSLSSVAVANCKLRLVLAIAGSRSGSRMMTHVALFHSMQGLRPAERLATERLSFKQTGLYVDDIEVPPWPICVTGA